MIYYTSDLHLGHANILKIRPQFSSLEDMNETLIKNWNRKVHQNDDVYILGDLSYRSSVPVECYLERLKGRKHLILGNHDSDWLKESAYERLSQYFVSIDLMLSFRRDKINITLCHYHMLEWNGSRHADVGDSYLIHGHIHSLKNAIYEYIKANQPTALNCGVEVNNFEPVTFEELVQNNVLWYGR